MKLKAIIIEDEKISLEILSSYLAKYCPDIEVLGTAEDVREGIALVRSTTFDILFLDIELPYGNAFDILESKGESKFETIFVTAYEKYAKEALNSHAAYYILKPISIDELIKAVDYIKQKLLHQNDNNEKVLTKIAISDNSSIDFIILEDIIYCKAQDNYTEFVLNGKKIITSKALKIYDQKLNGSGFIRIHRSFLINSKHVKKYFKGSGGYVLMSNGDTLDVAKNKKEAFLKSFK